MPMDNNLQKLEKQSGDKYIKHNLLSLLTLCLIVGMVLLFKGEQIEEYLNNNNEPLSDFQRAGLYFLFIVILVYLIIRMALFFKDKSRSSKLMGVLIIIMLIDLILVFEPLIMDLGIFRLIPNKIQEGLVILGIISLFIMFFLILENIFWALYSYFNRSKDIDSKATILLSCFALIISLLSFLL